MPTVTYMDNRVSQTRHLPFDFYLLFQGKPSSSPNKKNDMVMWGVRNKTGEEMAQAARLPYTVRVWTTSGVRLVVSGLWGTSVDRRFQQLDNRGKKNPYFQKGP